MLKIQEPEDLGSFIIGEPIPVSLEEELLSVPLYARSSEVATTITRKSASWGSGGGPSSLGTMQMTETPIGMGLRGPIPGNFDGNKNKFNQFLAEIKVYHAVNKNNN